VSDRHPGGMAVRRAVLGDAYVDRMLAAPDTLFDPLQHLITEFCWGTVWTNEAIDRRTRSLVNIAMLSALNRPHETALHLRGALRNGCTREEIAEIILQVAAYCGIPAAIETMKLAREAFADDEGMGGRDGG